MSDKLKSFADAIRLGASGAKGQCFNGYWTKSTPDAKPNVCALGAGYMGITNELPDTGTSVNIVCKKIYLATKSKIPWAQHCPLSQTCCDTLWFSGHYLLPDLIAHLNDHHRLSLSEIADYVESLEKGTVWKIPRYLRPQP